MRLATTKSDETVEQLATRVYGLEKPSASELKAATTALGETNPFLRKPADVPEGTVLLVPPLEGIETKGETQHPEPVLGGVAASQLRGAVALLARQLHDDVDTEVASARSSAKLARSAEVKKAAREDEDDTVAEELPRLATTAEQRVEDARAFRAEHRRVFGQVAADLDELLGVLGA